MSGRSGESKAELELRDYGMCFPEVTEDFPWGHRTLKVKKKAFVFMGSETGGFGLSVKLPESGQAALSLPFTEPTGYGLGKSGWVSANFPPKADVPVELLKNWLRESYLAVAPKKLASLVGGGAVPAAVPSPSPAKAKRPARKAAVAVKKPASAAKKKRAARRRRA
jgi:predicted DNA-binding protein (MmcQ/YjbR family)